MTTQEIAKEILKTATYHTNANLMTTLAKEDDPRKEEALDQSKRAESRMATALEQSKRSIIDEIRNSS